MIPDITRIQRKAEQRTETKKRMSMPINSDDFHFNCDLNPKKIMHLPTDTIIKYTASQGPFSEEKKFFLEKYKEHMKDHDEDCVDSSTTNLNENVKEISPVLNELCIRVLNYIDKLENERVQSKILREDLKEKSSVIFDSNTFPKFELDMESNKTARRVGRELTVIKRYFESVKEVESSIDCDEEFQNFLEEIVQTFTCMQTHHTIICGLLELEMDDSVVLIQEHLIDDEVRSKRFGRHYQLACVAVTYLTSLFNELDNVYVIPNSV